MTAVPEKVLNWLYSVLTSEYRDVNRTFSDVSQTLAEHPSLSPRTEVYTYEDGSSALLLRLSGNLPVWFRGVTYKFPILLWIPHAYPHDSPIVYVTPSESLVVRPGQYVSVEGRIYHPHLAQWGQYSDRFGLAYLLRVLQDVFSKEPPLQSMQQNQYGSASAAQSGPLHPRPPPPQESASAASFTRESSRPPPPPPKPQEEQINGFRRSQNDLKGQQGSSSLPPLPPKRPDGLNDPYKGQYQESVPRSEQQTSSEEYAYRRSDAQRTNGTPQPPLKPYQQQYQTPHTVPEPIRVSRYDQPPPLPPQAQNTVGPRLQQGPPLGAPAPQQYANYPPPQAQQYPPQQQQTLYNPHQQPQAAPPKRSQPIPDLLSSSLEVTLPSQQPSNYVHPAPPIPPNPEKDALLHALSQTLHAQLTNTVSQNRAVIPSLQAQQAALRTAHGTLAAELRQLQDLDAVLTSNERLLAAGIRDADRAMAEAQERAVPGVDEVLVAPTVVGSQLWNLCAEEAGIAEALYCLGRGLDAGRIGAEAFVKQTRALARERFLKKALIKKIARGIGLDIHG